MKISKRACKALQGSIKKWEKIVYFNGEDDGVSNCPLCELYYDDECEDCPVVIFGGGGSDCENTPYYTWTDHHRKVHNTTFPHHVKCDECEKLALDELNFLKRVARETGEECHE